jgi:asparagine synthase (glutamine-hydrolysing)
MCGIFSIINNNFTKEQIITNFDKGKSRGPENSQTFLLKNEFNCDRPRQPPIFLGFHRLAINGVNDENSNQPFLIDGIYLICNGEIYNWKKLYSMMGITGKSNSDCEVIIYLYKKYGIEQTLLMLDGVFAFMLIDTNSNNIFVARDLYGIRPLFIRKFKNSWGFASELKQLIDFPDMDDINIKQFQPGTYSQYNYSEMSTWKLPEYVFSEVIVNKRYRTNTPICKSSFSSLTIDDYCKQINESLTEAVRKRVNNTEREIACLLSGGLDSSLITALVKKLNPDKLLTTWSIGLKGSEDLKYARMVADHLGTAHNEIIISEEEFLSCFESVIYAIESYDTTTVRASIGNWLISSFIKENSNCKVVFNGDGSDEVCGGYMYFHCAPDSIHFDKECKKLLNEIHFFDVLRSDRSISSHGLEARTPFLDPNFVSTYMSIPADIRNHSKNNQCEKYLLRKAFDNGLLPKEVLWRTKEAFSDGVSSQEKPWFEVIQDFIKDKIFNHNEKLVFTQRKYYKHNTPQTLEQLHYRMVFESYFHKNVADIIPKFWMPNFVNATDASARTLDVYNTQLKKKEEKNEVIVCD